MKFIAYYLPQFHEIPENNKWWGKGFTEWTNVKKAKPLYKNHHQPRIPYNDYYYNLLEKETIEWQTELLHKYNIYGLCYYHYWFSGKKLLEKPAENLLKWRDINQNFCFCWANASWKKTWTVENKELIRQTYGNKEEWLNHINYLLPFFSDNRYIKIENKPIFVILNYSLIPNAKERFEFYDEICRKNGFAGIKIIQSINLRNQFAKAEAESITLREPSISYYSINGLFGKIINKIKRNKKINFFRKPIIYTFSKIANNSLNFLKNTNFKKQTYIGVFKEWDSTSRHGKHGFVIEKPTLKEFNKYLMNLSQIVKTKENVSDYVFFTAWNEWCECCYLEPDKDDSFKYLEIISKYGK